MSVPYPGNVNQPDRKDPSWEEYHTFEQRVNHELPDMRHEWKDDSRDEIGFGVPESNPPTVASVRIAANKAVRVAVLLLGEKVEDDVIEAQARDFMGMSGEAMDRTLDRFAKTQKLYAEDEDEDDADEKKASAELADKMKDKKSEDKSEDKGEEKKAEGDKKEMPEFIKEKIEESKEKKSAEKDEDEKEKKAEKDEDEKEKTAKKVWDKEEKKWMDASSEKDEDEKDKKSAEKDEDEKDKKSAEKDEDEKEKKSAEKDEDEKDKKAEKKDKEEDKKEAKRVGANEMDIELTSAVDEDVEPDPEADKQLASLFDDGVTAAEEEEEADEKKAKKAGIKKLGGQPKVASEGGESADISSIWNSAPDVSGIFR